jgi:secretion/DNA translocation related TadE-like protein
VRGEGGAGSVLAIGIIGATVLLCATALPLYTVLVARSSVAGAADAAALAAADARVGAVGGFPCDVAAEVAAANGSELVGCELDGYVATVSVRREVLGYTVSARATAGPSPENSD